MNRNGKTRMTGKSLTNPEGSDIFVESFARGLSVIRSFSEGREAQSLADIAKSCDISRATARRLIHTLINLGYARASGRDFFLTARILELGYSYISSGNLWNMAQPYLETAASKSGVSCSIAVLDDDDIIYVARASPQQWMRRVITIGSRAPAHAISMGRILMAEMNDDMLRGFISNMDLEKFTSFTVTDPDALFEQIVKDRARGWSLVDREYDTGISGIAMPIRNRAGVAIAGINLSIQPDQAQNPEQLEELRIKLTRLVTQIEEIAHTAAL